MSRKGNCWDNAVVESFFGQLKNELVGDRIFQTVDVAKTAFFEYIEVFYNRQRLHQTLGYATPEQYEMNNVLKSMSGKAGTVHSDPNNFHALDGYDYYRISI